MADEPQETAPDEPDAGQAQAKGVGRFLYRLALAGVGSVVLAQEELSGLFKRGENDSPDAEAKGAETEDADAKSDEAADPSNDPASSVNVTIDRVLHTFNLASRNDVDELTQKIEGLAAKVAALRG